MPFGGTWKEFKKIPKWAFLSYMTVGFFISYVINTFYDMGSLSSLPYVLTVLSPVIGGATDGFTGKMYEKFLEEWKGESRLFHILMIINALIFLNLFRLGIKYKKDLKHPLYGILWMKDQLLKTR